MGVPAGTAYAPSCHGTVTRPRFEDVLFLPQRPYMVEGSLRSQLLYPRLQRPIKDDELLETLDLVQLAHLKDAADPLSVEADWSKVLSIGEQQRLSFARLLLLRPKYAFLDEAMRCLLSCIPNEGPVDGKHLAMGFHGRDHRIRFRERSGEWLFHDDVRAVGRDLLHPFAVSRRRGTQDHDVGLGLLKTGTVIREDLVLRQREVFGRACHAFRLLVTDADDLRVRMFGRLPQQIAHVKVIEVNACDAPAFHDLGGVSKAFLCVPASQWAAPAGDLAASGPRVGGLKKKSSSTVAAAASPVGTRNT